jgi:hypothetical protein
VKLYSRPEEQSVGEILRAEAGAVGTLTEWFESHYDQYGGTEGELSWDQFLTCISLLTTRMLVVIHSEQHGEPWYKWVGPDLPEERSE